MELILEYFHHMNPVRIQLPYFYGCSNMSQPRKTIEGNMTTSKCLKYCNSFPYIWMRVDDACKFIYFKVLTESTSFQGQRLWLPGKNSTFGPQSNKVFNPLFWRREGHLWRGRACHRLRKYDYITFKGHLDIHSPIHPLSQ